MTYGAKRYDVVKNNTNVIKNSPRLGGLLLDVIPQQFEKIQPLDNPKYNRLILLMSRHFYNRDSGADNE